MTWQILDQEYEQAKIAVIGIGGGGGNMVNHMINSGIRGVDFICANTDSQDLSKIQKAKLIKIIKILHSDLKNKLGIKDPKITVLGLNPHAGENGKIGEEEIRKINPAVKACRDMGINASYAISADTAFNKKKLKETDAYLAMYHDQALPVLKAMSFGEAINITLGTSIVRTSVDHGTALDIAGKLKPNLQ